MKRLLSAAVLLCLLSTGCAVITCKDYFRNTSHPSSDLSYREQRAWIAQKSYEGPMILYINSSFPHGYKRFEGYATRRCARTLDSDYEIRLGDIPPRDFRESRHPHFRGYLPHRRYAPPGRYHKQYRYYYRGKAGKDSDHRRD